MTLELREVRKLAQEKSKRAYEIIEALMLSADKDSVKLAAAIAVLKLAGMPMTPEVAAEESEQKALTPEASEEELMAAAAKGEA